MKIIAVLLRLLRWSEVGLVCISVELCLVASSVFAFVFRLMPNASKLFAPIVHGRAQYCVANVPSNFPTVHGHLGSFFVGYSPHERTPWQRFRFRGPQAAMPCHAMSPGPGPGHGHGHGHESGPCVRLESFVLFDL